MPQNNRMLNTRYARALLSLAVENNILERSYADMKMVHEVFRQNKELTVVLISPVVRNAKKQKLVSHIFQNGVHPLMLRFMMIIIRKQRGNMLEGISGAYLTVYKQYLGIEQVKVTTAVPLNDSLRDRAMEAARKLTMHEIEFEEAVDPDLIGGFILNLGDKQYNASVKRRFQQIKKHLQNL